MTAAPFTQLVKIAEGLDSANIEILVAQAKEMQYFGAEILQHVTPDFIPLKFNPKTAFRMEIIALLREGIMPEQIGTQLGISRAQLKYTIKRLYIANRVNSIYKLALLLKPPQKMIGNQRFERLTKREREVAALAATGASCKEISKQLGIKELTTKLHISHCLTKLELYNKLQLIMAYRQYLASQNSLATGQTEETIQQI